MYERNGEYLDDERMNLDIQLDKPILVIVDLGLWNGRYSGYKEIKSGNIKESRKSETKAKSQTQKSTAAAESATQAQQTTAQATQAQKVCYITIEGYCSSKAVTLQGGDTVYSVLTRSGAAVSAENSQYGIYVNGINGRFASGSSGWMYSVNGYTPNVGCGSYSVSSGDNIRWYWGSAY